MTARYCTQRQSHCFRRDRYWRGAIRIIDFPQAVDPRENPRAFELLIRDVRNVCDCFRRHGVPADPLGIAQRLWSRYRRGQL